MARICFIKRAKRHILEARVVEVVYTDGNNAFVRGALKDGECACSEGTHKLAPGQMVSIPVNTKLSTLMKSFNSAQINLIRGIPYFTDEGTYLYRVLVLITGFISIRLCRVLRPANRYAKRTRHHSVPRRVGGTGRGFG